MEIRRKQTLNESPFSPTRVNDHCRRTPPLRDLLTACGNRTNYVPASTRGGVEDIKISRQLSADAEKETEGAIRSAVGTCVTCIQLLRTDSECGSTVRAMDWTRTGLGGRRGLRRRAAGERAEYLVTSRGGGAYVRVRLVESQNNNRKQPDNEWEHLHMFLLGHREQTITEELAFILSKKVVVKISLLCQLDESFPSACLHPFTIWHRRIRERSSTMTGPWIRALALVLEGSALLWGQQRIEP